MKRSVIFSGWMFSIAVMLAAGNVSAQQQFGPSAPLRPAAMKCCIAGTYDIATERLASPGCTAKKERNVLEIFQTKDCDTIISARTIPPDPGHYVAHFSGTVTPSTNDCCSLRMIDYAPNGDIIRASGTLCRQGGKWSGKGEGSDTSAGPSAVVCKTKWQMTQR